MSNFLRITKHPITGKFEEACWLDLGRKYRVEFKDGSSFREEEIIKCEEDNNITNK